MKEFIVLKLRGKDDVFVADLETNTVERMVGSEILLEGAPLPAADADTPSDLEFAFVAKARADAPGQFWFPSQ